MASHSDSDGASTPTRASIDGRDDALLRDLLRPRSTADQIADRLVTALALGEFVAGQRLPSERALAATLGVSRGRVRTALHRLADQGFLEIHRGRHGGAMVRSTWRPSSPSVIRRTLVPDWRRIEQLLDFIGFIEPLVARLAAERRTAEDVRAIKHAARAYREARDRAESSEADHAFHAALAAATDNTYLADLSSQLNQEVTLGFRAHPYSPALRETAISEHEALADLVAKRRADEAAEVMSEHVRLTERAVRELVQRVTADEASRDSSQRGEGTPI